MDVVSRGVEGWRPLPGRFKSKQDMRSIAASIAGPKL